MTDCLDVNRLVADGRRNSGRRRVTIAHVLENAAHTSYRTQPSSWETFMQAFRDKLVDDDESEPSRNRFVQAKVPLVSLADWNLAVNANPPGDFESPFCKFAGSSGVEFYKGLGGVAGESADRIRSMRFVTDSYLPPRELESDEYDLASGDGQPFDTAPTGGKNLTQIMQELNSSPLKGGISQLDYVHLYDYLDPDDVPTSLAVPTTERVPMVCAIKPTINSELALAGGRAAVSDEVDEGTTVLRTYEYKLDGSKFLKPGSIVQTLVAFPFRREHGSNESFTYDASLRLFLAPPGIGMRLVNGVRPENDSEFKESGYRGDGSHSVFRVYVPGSAPTFSSILAEEDAVKPADFPVANVGNVASALSTPLFWVKVRYQKDPETGMVLESGTKTIVEAHCNIPPVDEGGKPIAKYVNDGTFKDIVESGGDTFALHAAVYVRVKNGGGKTVDLVPASVDDDQPFNGVNNGEMRWQMLFGKASPILKFSSSQTFKFDMDGLEALPGIMNFGPQCLMCPDPRFNYAPENWMEKMATDAQTWIRECGADGADGVSRDGDIFMSVSNQGYLQSPYELAFLPAICNLGSAGGDIPGGLRTPDNPDRTAYPQKISECANCDHMWQTYRCYESGGRARHDFESLGLVMNDSAYRVNPFVQSVDALMPAFANTPYDWWAASTNNNDISASDLDSAQNFNKKYAFSEMNDSGAKFAWKDLRAIAENFRDKVRTKNGDWESAFDELGWESDENHFCGAELSGETDDLYGVDRKFLYGFWHDAFANRQQLFLVFVRAEPMMMGGGGVGQTPPALGARAVALVWRDPEAAKNGGGNGETPHRTRMLFYRQFD